MIAKTPCFMVLSIIAAAPWMNPRYAAGQTNVAVFNFQMKSNTPEWVWLEKCLADQITTDLSRGTGLSVIARDSMQAIAQEINWAPEMATGDAGKMGTIKKKLKIVYLISGVCVVKGDDIAIAGQIVSVASRKELFRKTVSGKAANVIGLQKRLSAELLSWFTKRPADKILPTLSVWTKSIPAIRALYQGMDLYDHGRYAEGWLKFRQASRADKGYIEAVYWTGKMYYFMGRYRHARRSIEKFVYMDEAHPRISDAVREYVHTYETRDTDPDDILRMYEYFRKRMPNAVVRPAKQSDWEGLDVDRWLLHRTAALLSDIGRYPQAARLVRPAFWNRRTAFGGVNVLTHNALTGKTLPLEVLAEPDEYRPPVYIPMGKGSVYTKRLVRWKGRSLTARASAGLMSNAQGSLNIHETLVAPSGYVFDSVHFSLKAQSGPATFSAAAGRPVTDSKSYARSVAIPVAQAVRDGVLLDKLPSTGYLELKCSLAFDNLKRASIIKVDSITVVAKLRKLGPCGALDIRCDNIAAFRVDVDGAASRWYPGIVGPLAEGEHTVTLHPATPSPLFLPWTTKVNVKAGKVTKVVGRLPRKPGLADWTIASVPGDRRGANHIISTDTEFPTEIDFHDYRDSCQPCRPAVLADDDAIRVVWSYKRDLWSSVSTDGKVFSRAAKLSLPVSTAWMEAAPRLLRDESGRFVLVFISNRDARHQRQLYVTWSRDFVHWSEPALVPGSDRIGNSGRYDFLYDNRRRFILASRRIHHYLNDVLISRDAYRWEMLPSSNVARDRRGFALGRLVQHSDGRFERLMVARTDVSEGRGTPLYFSQRSTDGVKWEPPNATRYDEGTWKMHAGDGIHVISLSAVSVDGRSILARFGVRNMDPLAILLCREADGTRWQSGTLHGLIGGWPELIHHPKWGYIIAWTLGGGGRPGSSLKRLPHMAHPGDGPFVMWGGDLLKAFGPRKPLVPVSASLLTKRRHQEREEYHPIPMNSPLGKLHYFGARGAVIPAVVRGAAAFSKVPAGRGTVSPGAIQASFVSKGLPFVIALDGSDEKKKHPDIIRIDVTGKGQFHGAPTIKGGGGTIMNNFDRAYDYTNWRILLPVGAAGKAPVAMNVRYVPSKTTPRIVLTAEYSAQAVCRIGKRKYRVYLVNQNNDLRFGRPGKGKGAMTREQWLALDDVYVETGPKYKDLRRGFDPWYQNKGYIGHPICVDGVWYEFVVSDDQKTVQVKPYSGPTGKLKIDHPAWRINLWGNKGLWVKGQTEPVTVPVGDYNIECYQEWTSPKLRSSKPGGQVSVFNPERISCRIQKGKITTLKIGSPLTGQIVAEQKGNELLIYIDWKDFSGNELSELRHKEPSILISSPGGEVLRSIPDTDLYGGNARRWKIPEGFKGTFVLSAGSSGAFPATVKSTKFTIKQSTEE